MCILGHHAAFSVARTPLVRNRKYPYGVPKLSPLDTERLIAGDALALFSLRVMKLCHALDIPCTLGQPASSWMLRLPPFEKAAAQLAFQQNVIDYCQYGMLWRKRITIWSTQLDLHPLERRCKGGTPIRF